MAKAVFFEKQFILFVIIGMPQMLSEDIKVNLTRCFWVIYQSCNALFSDQTALRHIQIKLNPLQ